MQISRNDDDTTLEQDAAYAKILLKEITKAFGDPSWTEDTSISDILAIYLMPYMEKKVEKSVKIANFAEDAKKLHKFWQVLVNKPRSGLQDIYVRKIDKYLKDKKLNFTVYTLAHAIIGLSKSDHHMNNGYYQFEYAVRSPDQVEKMIGRAEVQGISEADAKKIYDKFCDNNFESVPVFSKEYVNPFTGKKLK